MDMRLFSQSCFGGMIGGQARLKWAESEEKERMEYFMTIGKCAMSLAVQDDYKHKAISESVMWLEMIILNPVDNSTYECL